MEITELLKSLVQVTGIGFFLWFLIRGLTREIRTLKTTIETQSRTLDVMEKRILETEKIGELYKNLLSDLPDDIANYKKFINITKGEIITSLERANQQKDEELKRVNSLKLKELEKVEKIVADFPILYGQFVGLVDNLERKFGLAEDEASAMKKAISAILARNFSHNIGSQYLISLETLHDANIIRTKGKIKDGKS